MGFEFKPSIWFVCRICRQAFRYIYKLKEHKLECHLGECLKTKCLIFEERPLDHEWIPSTEELRSNDGPFSSTAGNSNRRNCYQNPFVSLQQLTGQQLNISLKKLPSASESIPREKKGRRRTGIKRAADKLLVSLSAPVEDEHCTEKKCNIDDGKHAEITTPIAVPQIVFDSEVQKIELNVEELQQLTENIIVSSSTSTLVCESNPVATVCEDSREIEIENREFIVASIVQNSDGTGNVQFMSTHVPEIGLLNQRNTFPTILDDAESVLNSVNGISAVEVQEEINSDEVDVENESNDAFFDEDTTIPLPLPAEEDPSESLPINFDDTVSTTDPLFDHSSASNTQHSPDQAELIGSSSFQELTPIPEPGHEAQFSSDSTVTCTEIETSVEPNQPSPVPVPLPLEPELPTSFRSRYNTRRKASKVNYSEIHACKGCAKDFYTVEDVEDHEKLCHLFRNKTNENKQAKETVDEEIQVIGSITKKTCTNEIVSDDEDRYESPNDSESDTENEETDCFLALRPRSQGHAQIIQILPTVTLSAEDLSLPLLDWITKEKSNDPSNVILLDPDPTSETLTVAVNDLNPMMCVLCKLELTSDTQVKEHVKVCWTFNKAKHVYCLDCKLSYSYRRGLVRHVDKVHKKLYTRNSKNKRRRTGSLLFRQNSLPLKDLECHKKLGSLDLVRNNSQSNNGSKATVDDGDETKIIGSKLKSAQCASKEIVEDGDSGNYECPGKSETGSDSEGGNCVIDTGPRSQGHPTLSILTPHTPIIIENYIPLKEWLPLQREKPAHSDGYKNVIRIDPDPTLADLDLPNIVIDKDHPVTCLLCSLLLFSEVHLKNHIENCWFHNKDKHRYCVLCEFRFQSPFLLRIHQEFDHFDYNSETRFSTDAGAAGPVIAQSASEMLQEPAQPVIEDESDAEVIFMSDEISLVDWLNERKGRASKNIILLDPDPTEAKTSIKISTKSPIVCKLCDRKLVSEYTVKVHVQKCWRHNKKAHVFCVPCSMQFGSSIILAIHNRVKHGLGEGPIFPFYCKYCSTGFKDTKALRIHRMSYLESRKAITGGAYNFDQDPSLDDPVVRSGPAGQPVGKSFAENRKGGPDISLAEWLVQQREANSSNRIHLDPDPLSLTPNFEAVTDAHPVTCKLCSRKFTAEALLRHHVQICWLRNKRIHRHCVHCNKTYETPKMLIHHNAIRHPRGPRTTFKCKVCAKEYKSWPSYKNHEKSHVDPDKAKPFKCEICGHSFRWKCLRDTHALSHSSERTFKCPHCPLTFIQKQALINHLAVHTLGKEDPKDTSKPTGTHLNCKFCDRFFTFKANLKAHERTHTGDRPFKCQVANCDRAFPSDCALAMHTKIKHSEELGLTQFLCPSCGKKFPLQSHLNYHTRRFHTEAKDKPFKCTHEGCNRTFSMKEQLNQHTLVHTGEKPFQCDQCGRAFAGKQSFKKHQLTHDDKGEGNKILCHLCPQTFSTDRGLQRHLKLGHEKGSKFKCQFCERGFATKSGLTKHEETHEERTDSHSDSDTSSD